MPKVKFAFHVHTNYSKDSLSDPRAIVHYCRKNNIKAISITDHNEIEGAYQVEKMAENDPFVIIGEEIKTLDGDLIALFIEKRILPGMSTGETIKQIRSQKGLICLPHPGESLRKEAISKEKCEKLFDSVELVEVFNSRTTFSKDNQWAKKKAIEYKKYIIVGSDAHFVSEINHAINIVNPFSDKESFLESIRDNDPKLSICKRTGLFIQALSKLVVIYKKIKR